MSVADLAKEMLTLPAEQRADLAQLLWSSLENAPLDVSRDEEAFCQELKRRDLEMTSDPASCFSHEEVMAEARRRLGC